MSLRLFPIPDDTHGEVVCAQRPVAGEKHPFVQPVSVDNSGITNCRLRLLMFNVTKNLGQVGTVLSRLGHEGLAQATRGAAAAVQNLSGKRPGVAGATRASGRAPRPPRAEGSAKDGFVSVAETPSRVHSRR